MIKNLKTERKVRSPQRFTLKGLLALCLLVGVFQSAPLGQSQRIHFMPQADGPAEPPIAVETVGADKAELRGLVPWCDLTSRTLEDGKTYVEISLPGVSSPNAVGQPNTPARMELIRIEPGGDPQLIIDEVQWQQLEGRFELPPVQPPIPDMRAPGGTGEAEKVPFTKDVKAYSKDAFSNPVPVQLDGTVTIRGRHFARIRYTPVSYNPARGIVRVAWKVRFHLEMTAPPQPKDSAAPALDGPLQPEALDARPKDGARFSADPFFAPQLDLESGGATAANYLIIAPDAFVEEVTPLAEWKHRKGYRTYIAPLSETGTTTESIKAYIQTAYGSGNLSYVLLVGDHEDLSGISHAHPACSDANQPFYSDLGYACVDGGDDYADIVVGRLPGDSEAQITTMVNKTLNYDRNPELTQRYDHVLVAGMFQDDEDGDYTANRWFMETMHRIGDFLGPDYDFFASETSKGYTVHGVFQWKTNCDDVDTQFDPTSPTLHYRADGFLGRIAVPDPVPAAWTNFGNGDGADINTAIEDGVALVFHRDHGYASYTGEWYDGLGWGDPDYQTGNVQALTNGNKLPFVFSLNCGTGHWEDRDAFAEAWMRNSSGGAVGFTGAARVSYSGLNDSFATAIMDTFWDDYSTDVENYGAAAAYPNSFRPAETLNRARAYVLASYSFQPNYAALTAYLYSWFGDPELALRTETPQTLSAAFPSSLTLGMAATPEVTVTRGGSPLEGALVALVMDPNDYYTTLTNAAGVARFSFTPNTSGTMLVTASERNSIPFEGSLSIEEAAAYYSLSYGAGPGGTISGNTSQTVAQGGDGSAVEAMPSVGWHFVQWDDGITSNPRTDTNITTDLNVTAQFTINTYFLFYNPGPGGIVTGLTSQMVDHGSDGSFVLAEADEGYQFLQWDDGITSNPRTDTNITTDLNVTAQFAINTYSLDYAADTGGTITGHTTQTVAYGSDGTAVEAVPDEGYHFLQWDDGFTSNPRTDTSITTDLSVMATFDVLTYTLQYEPGTSGTLTGVTSQTVNHGSDGSAVEAVPEIGCHFVEWSDGVTSNPRTDVSVTTDLLVTAEYGRNRYDVRFQTDGTAGATLTGTVHQQIYHGEDSEAVTAVEPEGYHFDKWTLNGTDYSTSNPLTVRNVMEPLTFIGEYKQDPPENPAAAGRWWTLQD